MGEARYFLRLGDIAGPSIVESHVGELELTELWWRLHSAASPAFGGGGGTGKAQVDALTAHAPTSIASPVLMQACAEGRHYADAVVTIQRAVDPSLDVLVITLRDVIVSSYALTGTAAGIEDELSLVFAQIELRENDGLREITAGWDVARNVRL
jgi:type VI secretion system secreted protein Hcp